MCSMIDLCFMCSNDNKCNIVDSKIVTQVEYLMPEITIIKLKLPLRICSNCEKNLQLFSTFKQDCVENSLRLEARMKEAQDDNADETEMCTTSETNINKIHEVYIKEEVVDESDNLDVKYSFDETPIKEEPIQETSYDREFGDVRQDIVKEISPAQTDTHLHEDSSVDMDDESDQNSDDPDDVVSVNNEINTNILVTDSTGCKVYTCLICKKRFKQLSHLKFRHMKIHLGKKDYQCNECKKWFTRNSSLRTHMKQHTGIKDFQCNECKKWFSEKSSLTKHMTIHTGVKDYQCNKCKKWFSLKSNLTKHMKTHTRVKDYQCNECKIWFSQKSYLVAHMNQHTRPLE